MWKRSGATLFSATFLFLFPACSKDSPTETIKPPPKVEIVSPNQGASVYGTISVQVTVVSEQSTVQVELLIDGQPDSSRILSFPPYSFTWSIPDEPDSTVHDLQAKATLADNTHLSSSLVRVVTYRFAPSNLRVSSLSEASIAIAWQDNSRFETGFLIERSIRDSTFVIIDSVTSNTSNRTFPGPYLTNTNYSFRVRAKSSQGVSNCSNVVLACISFPAPFIYDIESRSDSTIDLLWKDTSHIKQSFRIDRSTDGATFDSLISIVAGADSIYSTSLSGNYVVGQHYYFRVQTRSAYNLSPYSNIVSCAVVFLPPSGLHILSSSPSQVTLGWTVVGRSTQMVRLEKQVGGQGFHEIAIRDVSVSSYDDADVDTSQTYQYRVQAISGSHVSEYSLPLTVRYTSYGGFTLLRTFAGHGEGVWNVAFTADDQIIASSSTDHTVRLWDVATGNPTHTFYIPSSGFWVAPPISATSQYIAIGEPPSSITIHDPTTGALITTLPNAPYPNLAAAISFSPDGQFLASCVNGGFAVWRASDWSMVYVRSDYAMYAITMSPDNAYVATGDNQRYAHIYEAAAGSRFRDVEGSNFSPVRAVKFSPDSRELAVCGDEGSLYVWRVADGARIYRLPCQEHLVTMTYSVDGNAILVGGMNRKVYVWSQGNLVTTITEPNYVCGLAYSRDGRYLITGNYDHQVRLYSTGGWVGINQQK